MNYLVTGGCGFIGSHLVDALVAAGHQVRILDNLSTGTLSHKPPGAEFIFGDVADAAIVRAAMQGMDGCFHLAAVASVERSHVDWLETHRTNLTGTIAVFDAARAVRSEPLPVVYASSAAVYGDNIATPLTEDAIPRPLSAYGADKLGCETHAVVARHVHRVPNCGLRFFNVFGPRQDPRSPYSGVISIFCGRLLADRQITIYGDGQQIRDFVYVGDVVRALVTAMLTCRQANDVFNICTGRPTSVHDLAQTLGRILGVRPGIRYAPPRKGEVRSSIGDPAKARRMLGFGARTSLSDGLAVTVREMATATAPRARPGGATGAPDRRVATAAE